MTTTERATRYAIVVRITGVRADHPDHYVSREVGTLVQGNVSRYVEDAKTWGTERGANKWMQDRPDWLAYRTKNGGTVHVVPVQMARGSKVRPVCRA